MASSADWLTDLVRTDSGFTFNVTRNLGDDDREATVLVAHEGRNYTITVTQAADQSLYKGAVSARAREIVSSLPFITKVTSDSYTQIDDHVGMLQMQYNGQQSGTDYPMALFMYEIDFTGDVTLAVTCADDNDASIKATSEDITKLQTVRGQLAAMQTNLESGTVLGGVNGDFFRPVEEKYLIQGVCHREGVCLKGTFYDTGNTVFAIRKDGSPVIMNQKQYGELNAEIKEAIGGRQRLIHQGEIYGKDSDPYEPRTAVGVSKDKDKVYLLIIDGRNASWSHGARYYDLSHILLAAGAYNAINLDGGGSSSFVRWTAGDGKSYSDYTVLNKPMDGVDKPTERAVANGIAIIKQKK